MTIAILALQGAFAEHGTALDRLGVSHFEIRQQSDLERPFDALIIPGGESTVMRKLLLDLNLFSPLHQKIQAGLPVFGTCAGLLLLAKEIDGGTPCFSTMNIQAKRNAYGRQLGSFYTQSTFGETHQMIPMTFIRAPYIAAIGTNVQSLAEVDGNIVAAKHGNQLVTAFHPELTKDLTVHAYFINML